jgi:hypothetical protein
MESLDAQSEVSQAVRGDSRSRPARRSLHHYGNNVGHGDAASGALLGAAVGGAAGAYKGCREDGNCGAAPANHRQYYDDRAGRYYYYDAGTGRYYWEDGSPR